MSKDRIVRNISQRAFQTVMSNLIRPIYVEAMVWDVMGKDWHYCGEWDGWDLERKADGARLEVKQSAVRQTWTDRAEHQAPSPAIFDICTRQGYFDRQTNKWVQSPGRHAHLYVFADHPIFDAEKCDQRVPHQWDFYVLQTTKLPKDQQTIRLRPLKALGAKKVEDGYADLRDTVHKLLPI